MAVLLFLFVLIPAVELALLVELGAQIGTLRTLAVIVATGVVGASLARRQGLGVLSRMNEDMSAGRLPGDALLDGAIILVAGALLITPGILTDAVGFACLIPPIRSLFKRTIRARLARAVSEGSVQVGPFSNLPFGRPPPDDPGPRGPVIDVTPEPPEDPPDRGAS